MITLKCKDRVYSWNEKIHFKVRMRIRKHFSIFIPMVKKALKFQISSLSWVALHAAEPYLGIKCGSVLPDLETQF